MKTNQKILIRAILILLGLLLIASALFIITIPINRIADELAILNVSMKKLVKIEKNVADLDTELKAMNKNFKELTPLQHDLRAINNKLGYINGNLVNMDGLHTELQHLDTQFCRLNKKIGGSTLLGL
jgi:hypothetical protein